MRQNDSNRLREFDGKRERMVWGGLPDELVCLILTHNVSVEDLLRVSGVCRRLATVVNETEVIWERLYERHYALTSGTASGHGNVNGNWNGNNGKDRRRSVDESGNGKNRPNWQAMCKERHLLEIKRTRIQKRVKLMRLNSDVEECKRLLEKVTWDLKKEQQKRNKLNLELKNVRLARNLNTEDQFWHPLEIRSHLDTILGHAGISGEWKELSVKQELDYCDFRLRALRKRLGDIRKECRARGKRLKKIMA